MSKLTRGKTREIEQSPKQTMSKDDIVEKPIDAHIHGPSMAWVLSHALARVDVDETHAIFGQARILLKEGDITDAEGAGVTNTRRAIDITIKFITKLPLSVWNPSLKEWNHEGLRKWEENVKAHLRLNRGIRVVGLARFRRSDFLTKTPFSLRDVKLCQYVSETEKIPTVLMAITVPRLKAKNRDQEQERNLLNSTENQPLEHRRTNYLTGATNVTTGYFDANEKDYDYINLVVSNMGQEPASYLTASAKGQGSKAATVVTSQDLVQPLVAVSVQSAQLRQKLQAVHDEYQKKQLHLVRQLAASTTTVSSSVQAQSKKSYDAFQQEQDDCTKSEVETQHCKRPKMER